MEETKMSEVIVITSGKGGVGKTTTIAKIASHLRIESFIIWLTLWKETAESNRQ